MSKVRLEANGDESFRIYKLDSDELAYEFNLTLGTITVAGQPPSSLAVNNVTYCTTNKVDCTTIQCNTIDCTTIQCTTIQCTTVQCSGYCSNNCLNCKQCVHCREGSYCDYGCDHCTQCPHCYNCVNTP